MRVVETNQAPQAIGPYSQATIANNLMFISGQIPLDAESGELQLFDNDVAEQTRLVLKNLLAILQSENCDKTHVLKTTIYVTDMNDFAKINEVYGEFFGQHKPARATVGVASLPKGVRVEIEAIAQLRQQ